MLGSSRIIAGVLAVMAARGGDVVAALIDCALLVLGGDAKAPAASVGGVS
jgi:hypothetical protein